MPQSDSSPIDIARQALKQLALRKIPPTPDNFRQVYDEIAGTTSIASGDRLAGALDKLLKEAGAQRPKFLKTAKALDHALQAGDWAAVEACLAELLPAGEGASWAGVVRTLVRQLEANHRGLTASKKKEGLERVLVNFESDPEQLAQKIQSLVNSWGVGGQTERTPEANAVEETLPDRAEASGPASGSGPAGALASMWRDLLIKSLELGLMTQLKYLPELSRSAQLLLEQARQATTEKAVRKLAESFKSFWYALEMNSDAQFRLHEELLHLMRLLVDNMGELVVDDQWLHGQTEMIRDIIARPLDIDVLYEAESSLKELIFKQGKLKHGLAEARNTLKQMASTFIGRLAEITENTGEYHRKIEHYQTEIASTEDITELNVILDRLMTDTRSMQLDALRSHEELQETQKKVVAAEQRIRELTEELDQASALAHQDYLTGALNRRGMHEAMEREFSRADRTESPLCIALMDVDHFKKLNDALGHETGDQALKHLVKATRDALRPTDVLARFGGEEFVIILPETRQDEAIQVMTRVQRALTKNFFLHQNERVLITFSAGVAQRNPVEGYGIVIKRADRALYQAKQTGRNRVLAAD